MKKYILLLLISLMLFSCSSNRPLSLFMKDEMNKNKEQKIISILYSRKTNPLDILNVYSGLKIGNRKSSQAKSFTQKEYDELYVKYKNDTIAEYWNKTDAEKFNFDKIIKYNEVISMNDSFENYLYTISKPLFINEKALFSITITKGRNNIIENCVIIMKKEKGNWIFLEKVYNTEL